MQAVMSLRAAAVTCLPASLRMRRRAAMGWLRDKGTLRLLTRLGDRHSLAIDIGAEDGVTTYCLWRRSAGVVAFEPRPSRAAFLDSAFDDRVRVERVALSIADGLMALRIPTGHPPGGRSSVSGTLTVTRRRLDGYAWRRVGCIRVGIRRNVLDVLKGGQELLRRDRPHLLIEADPSGQVESVTGWLEEAGYAVRPLAGGSLIGVHRTRAIEAALG